MRIGCAAAWIRAAAPLVSKHDLGAVVVERGRVPVGEVLVRDLVEARRAHRIRYVEQDAVAGSGARGKPDFREDRDVVALVCNA